jgi:hypothetical protein
MIKTLQLLVRSLVIVVLTRLTQLKCLMYHGRSLGLIYKAEGNHLRPITFLLVPRRANSMSDYGVFILSPQNSIPFHKI